MVVPGVASLLVTNYVAGTGNPDRVPKFITLLPIRVMSTPFSTMVVQNTSNFWLYLQLVVSFIQYCETLFDFTQFSVRFLLALPLQ